MKHDLNLIQEGKMATLKEEAKAYEPKTQVKNIAELEKVSTDFELKVIKDTNKETGEEFEYKYLEINGEKYRVPWKVLGDIKIILEENPNLKEFKVKRTGIGRDTRYTVIPLS